MLLILPFVVNRSYATYHSFHQTPKPQRTTKPTKVVHDFDAQKENLKKIIFPDLIDVLWVYTFSKVSYFAAQNITIKTAFSKHLKSQNQYIPQNSIFFV